MPSILNFEIKEPKHKVTGEDNPNFIYEDDVQAEDIPIPEATPDDFTDDETPPEVKQEIIEFVKKPDIVEEEIFSNAPVRKKGKATRSTSPKKTKRKPLSEETKAKRREALARGRETRMRNLAQKKKEKQDQQTATDLTRNQQRPKTPPPQIHSPAKPIDIPEPYSMIVKDTQMRQSITHEDIERSQMNTLLAYEKIRKQRKAEKKQVKQIEQEQQRIKQTIQQVSAPSWGSQRHRGKYGGLLQGMGL